MINHGIKGNSYTLLYSVLAVRAVVIETLGLQMFGGARTEVPIGLDRWFRSRQRQLNSIPGDMDRSRCSRRFPLDSVFWYTAGCRKH